MKKSKYVRNCKYPEEYEIWLNAEIKSLKWITVYQRLEKWWDIQEAIKIKDWRISKYMINEKWRECSKCWFFKEWDLFPNDYKSKSRIKKVSQCKECRNKKKAEYRQTIQGKIKCKNYRVIKRADPLYRRKEAERYKIRAKNNKETRDKSHKVYQIKNKEKILARRREREKEYFSVWKKVYFWKLVWKIKEVIKRKWCLVALENWMVMWIAKWRLKPYRLISDIKRKNSLNISCMDAKR